MLTHEQLRNRLTFLTIESAVMILRHFGDAVADELLVLSAGGYCRTTPAELVQDFNPKAPTFKVGPVYFYGGPNILRQYKGNYLTFIVDRAMRAQFRHGPQFVEDVITYVEGVTTALALPRPKLDYPRLCNLIRALHHTRTPIEHALDDLGLVWTDYDLDDVEQDMLDMGLGQCESCGLWEKVELMDGADCDRCSLQKAIL